MICCDWMQNGIRRMNDKGMTIVPRSKQGDRYFVVRFRALAPELWAAISAQLPKGTPFSSGAELAINCCPGCGRNLREWIQNSPDEFESLVSQVID